MEPTFDEMDTRIGDHGCFSFGGKTAWLEGFAEVDPGFGQAFKGVEADELALRVGVEGCPSLEGCALVDTEFEEGDGVGLNGRFLYKLIKLFAGCKIGMWLVLLNPTL